MLANGHDGKTSRENHDAGLLERDGENKPIFKVQN